MCGFAGLFDLRQQHDAGALKATAAAMAATLVHRGPDDAGTWADPDAGVALGSRRLAVIDLSAEGHQPMTSESGRYVLAYNGEIYNFASLRHRLEGLGARYSGHSDTEVLLSAIEHWGIDKALSELNGMFAFALWDRREGALTLARDRLGEKPLYFGWAGSVLVFGSELKALLSFPGFRPELDRAALALYFALSRVPAPHTIYEGVFKLRPGTLLVVPAGAPGRGPEAARAYWSAAEVAAEGASHPLRAPVPELVDTLEETLGDAVELRLNADVPVGVFLSGGIDSSTVVALMCSRAGGAVRSFTIGSQDPAYDESRHAAAVARHLGTEHTELLLSAPDTREVIAKLAHIYDEPFADSSQIPTYLVSRLARGQVTVALSGDGGDELFGGYNRHTFGPPILRAMGRVPDPFRRALARILTAPSPSSWDAFFARFGALLPRRARMRIPGIKVQKLARVLAVNGTDALYRMVASTWQEGSLPMLGREPEDPFGLPPVPIELDDEASRMMYLDLVSYLPDDILVKLDRATMAVSLESRVPMLDHRVVELAWRIPAEVKIKGTTGKWILRELLRRHVPSDLVERPKSGFGLPIGAWLRGPLRSWADELLARERLDAEGYLDSAAVHSCWQEHLGGTGDRTDKLWAVLMFEQWLETYRT
ncbi:MAG: asparagine synthase (glutamine-hydrolyzing) [Acidimicrobiales bacterium]